MEQIGIGNFEATRKHKEYVTKALNDNRISYGDLTRKFEKEFSKAHTLKFACFCNSGTSALQIAIAALKETGNWQDGDEVLCPALTFVATSNIILSNNLKPVFVDVEKDYYGIDSDKIKERITNKTKAIMVAHLFGMPCDMDPIIRLADKYNLKVVEDSCETMFATYKGKSVGSFGDISCFSTYVAHLIVTGVGGFACTNNPEYAKILRSLMNHGRDNIYTSIDDDKNKSEDELREVVGGRFKFIRLGYSYRATELEAALGLAELEQKNLALERRRFNANYLIEKLSKFSEFIQLPKIRPGCTHSFMMFPIVIKNPRYKKKELVNFLENNKIETRDMLPLINQPFYVKMFGDMSKQYPVSDYINNNGFYIGCHPGMSRENLSYIVQKFEEFFSK